MDRLCELTLTKAIEGLKKKDFSRVELVTDVLSRIRSVDKRLFSFISVNDKSLKEAEILDEENDNRLLSGIPVAVKEVLSTKGVKTTASSKILENYLPVYDATVVKKIKDSGGIIIGKTNCDAFAFGASTENSGFGPTRNPWDIGRVPGGSSGGSVAAVAADECLFALGTDTGGSIRQPASFCNITGLKPTYGVCSRFGLLAMGSSFDCPGPMAKDVDDCEIIFDVIRGVDPNDATSVNYDALEFLPKKNKLTIGLPKEFFSEGIDEEVKVKVSKAVGLLQNEGFETREISLPYTDFAIAAYYVIVPSEISSNMSRYTGIRFGKERENFEDEVKRRIMIGTYALSAGYFDQFYLKALKLRRLIREDYLKAFSMVDLIIGPVSPTPAFKIGEKVKDPVQMYMGDVLTVGVNMAGIPALALPCGFTENNLPVGMQIIGPHFSERLLFKVGKFYQQLTDWHKKKPQI